MYGIFAYIWLKFMVNLGKYTSPMDGMGSIPLPPVAIPFVWDNGSGFHVQGSNGQLELFAS